MRDLNGIDDIMSEDQIRTDIAARKSEGIIRQYHVIRNALVSCIHSNCPGPWTGDHAAFDKFMAVLKSPPQ